VADETDHADREDPDENGTDPLADLVTLLTLEQLEVDLYRGRRSRTSLQRVFGGQVAGQALVAAGSTVDPARGVHSLHAYFLRPGDPSVPIVYAVDRTRDGRSFSTRRVVATQRGSTIFTLTASFTLAAEGLEHQDDMPVVPSPESLPSTRERMAPYVGERPAWWQLPRPIDLRYVGDPPRVALEREEPTPPRSQVWFRAAGSLPDDPLLHVCVLTYASDMSLLDSAILPHRIAYGYSSMSMASLDHAVWFHRPFRADEWLLYDQESPTASAARGLGRGRIFSADGRLVCTVVQEGLIRVLD